jgi:hypothetical protein
VTIHKGGEDGIVTVINGTYPWLFGTEIFRINGQPSHGDDCTTFEKMTST